MTERCPECGQRREALDEQTRRYRAHNATFDAQWHRETEATIARLRALLGEAA